MPTDRDRSGSPAAESGAERLLALGWKRRETYSDGVIRLTRGHMAVFVGADGSTTRPATKACMTEFARLCGAGVPFR